MKYIAVLLKDTGTNWINDKAQKLAAALAYYTVISLAPLLLIVMGVASLFFKADAVRGEIAGQLSQLVGQQSAEMIQSMLASSQKAHGVLATVVGLLTMFIGATGVFGELQDSLNMIWRVKPEITSGFKAFVKTRILSFGMVLGIGFLLTVSLLISAALSAFGKYVNDISPLLKFVWHITDFAVSLAILTFLFTEIFCVLPDAEVHWRDTWLGGLLTAILFTIGKVLLGAYLGSASVTSGYGAAGSLVIVLIWVYYTSQILFVGAEFTHAYALSRGYKSPLVENQTPTPKSSGR